MFGSTAVELPVEIGFVPCKGFSMMDFSSAIEPLRLANRIAGEELYRWHLASQDGRAVRGANGIPIGVNGDLKSIENVETVFVCTGIDVQSTDTSILLPWLRRMATTGMNIGATCTGAHVLAKAGLLDGHRCTIHWENLAAFTEVFPDIEVTTELFEIDRKRVTCSGGTAAIDLMLNMITTQHGYEIAAKVADQFMHERIRDQRDQQRVALPARIGVRHPKLLSAIKAMEDNLEEPLGRQELAELANLSTRQLERLFRKYLKRSPARYYLELRLNKSRLLLLQTAMPVIDVALACGFVSASHFSKCYRDFYGKTPRQERAGSVGSASEMLDLADVGFEELDDSFDLGG